MFLPCGGGGGGGGQESPKLATALPCEKDMRTPSCQLKFKCSFAMNFTGRLETRGWAAVLMPGLKAVSVLPFVPHRPGQSNMTAVEEFIFCMVTLASVFAL